MIKEKKPTINDIAAMTGVSKATVSMVLSKKDQSISERTRSRILQAAEEIGYVPNLAARSLNTGHSGTIGVIVPDITNPFFAQMARAVEDAAGKLGYSMILCNSDNDDKKETSYAGLLAAKQADGVILMSGGKSRSSLAVLAQNGIPIVPVDRPVNDSSRQSGVYFDNAAGITEAVQFLYEKGKRNIAFVSEQSRCSVFQQRLEAYIRLTKEYGIFYNAVSESSLDLPGGIKATEKLLGLKQDLDAILYCADIMALGGLKLLTKKQIRVPEDIGLMGFDNIQAAEYSTPGLTTVEQPVYEMGKTAFEMLLDRIKGKKGGNQVVFTPRLIVRESV